MVEIVRTPPSLRDVARLHGFLAARNRDAARQAVQAIRQGVRALRAHPGIGQPIDELPAEFREWLIEFGNSRYAVLYQYDGRCVAILTVRQGKEAGS